MKHSTEEAGDKLKISYSWKTNGWNKVQIEAENSPQALIEGSEFDFITEHYFGYTKNKKSTTEYEVQHPKWNFYKVTDYKIDLDFKENYGDDFEFLNRCEPNSVMLAEGSEVSVQTKKNI